MKPKTMNDQHLPFLGAGWSFPPEFTANGGQVLTVEGVENVHKSVVIILQTSLGERAMREEFGGSLKEFQFEPLSAKLVADIKEHVRIALLRNEPRVDFENVTITQDDNVDGMILVRLQYSIKSNNTRFNLVFPFYINEASIIPS